MQKTSGNAAAHVVVLGTGGTIAGTASSAADNVGYSAAQRGVADLLAAVPALGQRADLALETEQVAQIDSKDMGYATWLLLAQRVAFHLARAEVAGIVVTHGTDTLEETAWFLQRVLSPRKPVVLTAAMRPATSLQADGPQNLVDAIGVALQRQARGVVLVFGGAVHGARDVRKQHPYRIGAFGSGDAGAIAWVEEGSLRQLRDWPDDAALLDVADLVPDIAAWPWVEILTSGVQADGAAVRALTAAGVRGIVAAGTGNGTLNEAMEQALKEARSRGVLVWRATRCLDGRVLESGAPDDAALPSAGDLTPFKARVELMLRLMSSPRAGKA